MNLVYLALSQKTQDLIKVILIIFLVVILVFAIFGFIGNLIEKTMKAQGKKVDVYMTNVVISRICDKPKDFVRIAKEKNRICFFKASITPIILMLIALIVWVSYHIVNGNWSESIFDTVTGVGTLFYTFDFSKVEYVAPLGFAGITVSNYPHFLTNEAATNYIIFAFLLVGYVWYLINIQAYFSRLYRINELRKSIYSKDLSTIDITHFYNLDKVNPYADQINQNKGATTTQQGEVNSSINNSTNNDFKH
jgi:hypothetical protein